MHMSRRDSQMSTVGSHSQLNRNVRAGNNNNSSMVVPLDKKEYSIKVTPQKLQSQVSPKPKVISYVDDFEKISFLEPPLPDTRTIVREEIERLQYPAKFARIHEDMDEIQDQFSNLLTEQLEIFKKEYKQENVELRQAIANLNQQKDKDKEEDPMKVNYNGSQLEDSMKEIDLRLNFMQSKIKEEQTSMLNTVLNKLDQYQLVGQSGPPTQNIGEGKFQALLENLKSKQEDIEGKVKFGFRNLQSQIDGRSDVESKLQEQVLELNQNVDLMSQQSKVALDETDEKVLVIQSNVATNVENQISQANKQKQIEEQFENFITAFKQQKSEDFENQIQKEEAQKKLIQELLIKTVELRVPAIEDGFKGRFDAMSEVQNSKMQKNLEKIELKLNVKVNEAVLHLQNEFKKQKDKFDQQRSELDLELDYSGGGRRTKKDRKPVPEKPQSSPRVETSKGLFDLNAAGADKLGFFGEGEDAANQISQIKEEDIEQAEQKPARGKARRTQTSADLKVPMVGHRKGSGSSRVHGDGQYFANYKSKTPVNSKFR